MGAISSRRQFLTFSLAAAATAVAAPAIGRAKAYERQISFRSLHTGESLDAVYWAGGRYVAETLRDINTLLRDHRTGDVTAIDPKLMDALYSLHRRLGSREPYEVISGYRSPKTNAMLRGKSNGVAKKSYHMKGQAVDIALPDRALTQLHRAALDLKAGGVGLYTKSGFVHLDTGRVRSWGG